MLLRVLAESSSLYGVHSFTLIKLPSEAYQLSFLISPVTLFSTTKVTSSFQCTHKTILKSIIIIIPHKPSCFIQLLQDSSVGGNKKMYHCHYIACTFKYGRNTLYSELSPACKIVYSKTNRNLINAWPANGCNSLLKECVAKIEHLKAESLCCTQEEWNLFFWRDMEPSAVTYYQQLKYRAQWERSDIQRLTEGACSQCFLNLCAPLHKRACFLDLSCLCSEFKNLQSVTCLHTLPHLCRLFTL